MSAHGFSGGDIAFAVCDRCHLKRPYTVLISDPNFHGLRVCGDKRGCWDNFDPYRLPPRQTEAIVMRYPRPDVSVAPTTLFLVCSDNALLETENGCWLVIAAGT